MSNNRFSVDRKLDLLGYPPDTRLLIVNGDDLGVCHAATVGTFAALEHGLLTSASLMVPCPWAYAACTYLREHPNLDVGVHLTLTSEWPAYHWGPVLGQASCPSLCDRWGFFYPSAEDVWSRSDPEEALAEAEVQIERARAWGLEPSHLDGHMLTLYAEARYIAIYIELARRHRLPLRMGPRRLYAQQGAGEEYDALPLSGLLTNDDLRFVALQDAPALEGQLIETLRTLSPGITELVAHVAEGTAEAQAIMSDWEARAEALRLLTASTAIREELERNGIVLVGWKELREAQRRLAG